MAWANYKHGETNPRAPRIYDDRLGSRYFDTVEERDAYYNAAQWIDQKHWTKLDD